MATQNKTIIVDSSALVSLLKRDDVDHEKAVIIIDGSIARQQLRVILPSEVLAETLNILGKKLGNRAEVVAGRALLNRIDNSELLLTSSNPNLVRTALELRATYTGNPSFIDCLVMSYAEEYQTNLVFGFDETFRKNGYQLP